MVKARKTWWRRGHILHHGWLVTAGPVSVGLSRRRHQIRTFGGWVLLNDDGTTTHLDREAVPHG